MRSLTQNEQQPYAIFRILCCVFYNLSFLPGLPKLWRNITMYVDINCHQLIQPAKFELTFVFGVYLFALEFPPWFLSWTSAATSCFTTMYAIFTLTKYMYLLVRRYPFIGVVFYWWGCRYPLCSLCKVIVMHLNNNSVYTNKKLVKFVIHNGLSLL